MLEELREYKDIGSKSDIEYIVMDILGEKGVHERDLRTLNSLNSKGSCEVNAIIILLMHLNIIKQDNNRVFMVNNREEIIRDRKTLSLLILEHLLDELCNKEIFTNEMFEFLPEEKRFLFRKELFPIKYSQIRNLLVSYDFFYLKRTSTQTNFYVNNKYEYALFKYLKINKKKMNLKELKRQLENNSIAGEKAEEFVMKFESQRLGGKTSAPIKQISIVDVTAGYDIASFQSIKSKQYDRFIEVKAVNHYEEFFWSNLEIEVAKKKKENYYLYLVELNKINLSEYEPEIIVNPYERIFQDEKWLLEAQNYKVKRVIKS